MAPSCPHIPCVLGSPSLLIWQKDTHLWTNIMPSLSFSKVALSLSTLYFMGAVQERHSVVLLQVRYTDNYQLTTSQTTLPLVLEHFLRTQTPLTKHGADSSLWRINLQLWSLPNLKVSWDISCVICATISE